MSASDNHEKLSAQRLLFFGNCPVLLWIILGYLVVNSIMLKRDLSQMKQRPLSQEPVSVQEVASQFQKQTLLPPISTKVEDVRYSPKNDSYKVDFSWTNSDTGDTWYTDIKLTSDGYGQYFGMIQNGPFVEPTGHENGYSVVVKSPSRFKK